MPRSSAAVSLGGLRVDIGEHDARTLAGEHGGDAAPDAARGARDDGDLIGERLHDEPRR